MYSLTIHFGPNALQWQFLFKGKEKADEARSHVVEMMLHENDFCVEDDFGQVASFIKNTVCGVLLEDLEQAEEAHILRSLSNARGKVKAQQRAATDPIIRQAQSAGPAVISPMGNFRG